MPSLDAFTARQPQSGNAEAEASGRPSTSQASSSGIRLENPSLPWPKIVEIRRPVKKLPKDVVVALQEVKVQTPWQRRAVPKASSAL